LTYAILAMQRILDHDFGCNNADQSYEFRHESAIEYVTFLGQPSESPMSRRAHAGLGVYGVKLFDFDRLHGEQEVPDDEASIDPDVDSASGHFTPIPTYSNRSVAVFVLDVRSNKSPWKQGIEGFQLDYEGDFLGEEQWEWFETAIRRSRAAVNVVVTGLQVHAQVFPNGNIAESWGMVPKARQRLMDAVLQDGVQAPILISGDVHMTQIMRKDCESMNGGSAKPRSLVEMTTSGMTHSWGSLSSPPLSDPGRLPTLWEKYETFIMSTTMRLLHTFSPWTALLISDAPNAGLYHNGGGEGAKEGLQYSLEKNFGELEFDWEQRSVAFRAMGEHAGEPPLLMANWTIDQLSGIEAIPGSLLTPQNFLDETKLHQTYRGEWTCINHRGSPSILLQGAGFVTTVTGISVLLLFPVVLSAYLALMLILGRRYRRRRLLSPKPNSRFNIRRVTQLPPHRMILSAEVDGRKIVTPYCVSGGASSYQLMSVRKEVPGR
jgi:PhoD-like phosphatase